MVRAVCSLLLLAGSLLSCFALSNEWLLEQTLDASERQLDALTHRLLSLSNQLDEILAGRENYELQGRRLAKKLDLKEGTTGACKRGFFPCNSGPDGGVQCVKDYLVCDGSADCKNGADEADNICGRMPFTQAFHKFGVVSVGCQLDFSISGEEPSLWLFNGASIIPWFPSRPVVTWTVLYTLDSPGTTSYAYMPEYGFYDYATGDILMPFLAQYGLHGYIRSDQMVSGGVQLTAESWRVDGDGPCLLTVLE